MQLDAPHRDLFRQNIAEVSRLLQIHSDMTGATAGYKHNVEVLNKSAIILLVATWESYIEELAKNCFDFMIANCETHTSIPNKVRALAVKEIKASKNDLDIWKVAGKGWIVILQQYKNEVIEKHIESLNTPRTSNLDELFESILGIKTLSKNWYWKGMSNAQCIRKLETLVTIRGDIAHTVRTAKPVNKTTVQDYVKFLNRIAAISHNRCNEHLSKVCGKKPWKTYRYHSSK